MLKRVAVFAYGVACYAAFLASFLYAIGFVGNLFVPRSLDSAARVPVLQALSIDFLLLGLFAVQHSVMARSWFKRMWTKVVPEVAERSTYVLFSSVALLLLFRYWEPVGGVVWNVESAPARQMMYSVFALGFGLVLISSLLINHFDLFGVRQTWLYLLGKPYSQLKFQTPLFYRYVRHPLYVGWFMAFWFTPTMTATHLFFALMTSAYMLAAIRWEERDLLVQHGERYARYRQSVPMLIPATKGYESVTRTGGAEEAA